MHNATLVQNFVLISDLGIGGSIIYRKTKFWLLDVGYIIVKATKSNVQRELGEAQLIRSLVLENRLFISLSSLLCRVNSKIHNIQRFLLTQFPEISHDLLFPKNKGYFMEPIGDALLLYKCKKITKYKIFWNQKYNHTCYELFPIEIKNDTKFLELKTRRILKHSTTIDCDNRLTENYVKDKTKRFWKYNLDKNFTILPKLHKIVRYRVHLPKLAEYNRKLLHYKDVKFHRSTLLDILNSQTENLDKLSDFKSKGKGNILEGIISEISDSVGYIADSGINLLDHIVSDVDKSINTITNSTDSIIDTTANGLSKIFAQIGIPSFALILTQICIILYMLYLRLKLKQCMNMISQRSNPPTIYRDRKPLVQPSSDSQTLG
jgi:hypothetical protein